MVDNTPSSESRYRARFYFDPNSITMADLDTLYFFSAFSSTGRDLFHLYLRFYNSEYQIRASIVGDAGLYYFTQWYSLTDAPHFIEIDWQAGAGTGSASLWIDGSLRQTISGITSPNQRVDTLWLGPYAGIDTGTRGVYSFDAFESRRQNPIGGVLADFTADPTGGNAPFLVQFTDRSLATQAITYYRWDFGDGTRISTLANPQHT